MSNLGMYQTLTTASKKLGGPIVLVASIFGIGALFGGGVVAGGTAIKKKVSAMLKKRKQSAEAAIEYSIHTEGKSNEGLLFSPGDRFKVLEIDGDACLIEKLGDNNNP